MSSVQKNAHVACVFAQSSNHPINAHHVCVTFQESMSADECMLDVRFHFSKYQTHLSLSHFASFLPSISSCVFLFSIFFLDLLLHFLPHFSFSSTPSSSLAELQVRINNQNTNRPLFTTRLIGRDNSIARHGIHELYWLYGVDIQGNLLVKGNNTFYLTQPRNQSPFQGIMYDYIRLEAPVPAPVLPISFN